MSKVRGQGDIHSNLEVFHLFMSGVVGRGGPICVMVVNQVSKM